MCVWGGREARCLPSHRLQPREGFVSGKASKEGSPQNSPREKRKARSRDGGRIRAQGKQLPFPLRLFFLPALRAEESRTPKLPAKAPRFRSTSQLSPGCLCSSPPLSPAPLPLPACLLLPKQQPSPQLVSPQGTKAFLPPPLSTPRILQAPIFSTAARCLPAGPACTKVKTSRGRERLCSISPNCRVGRERRGGGRAKTSCRVLFPGVKSRAAHRCPPPGMGRPPVPDARCIPEKSRPPPSPSPSLPAKGEGRVAGGGGGPLPCGAPQVLYPPSSLCQIPNGKQQHIQG